VENADKNGWKAKNLGAVGGGGKNIGRKWVVKQKNEKNSTGEKETSMGWGWKRGLF